MRYQQSGFFEHVGALSVMGYFTEPNLEGTKRDPSFANFAHNKPKGPKWKVPRP